MTPLARRLQFVSQSVVQLLPHANDAVCHTFDLRLPLSIKVCIAQDGVGNSGAVQRRVGVHGPNNDFQLAVNTSLLLGVQCGQGESANTLSIKTHVFSEGLSKCDLMALRNKVPRSESILGGRTRSKPLVRHVKEGEQLLLLQNIGNLCPLPFSGVDTSGVVGASME